MTSAIVEALRALLSPEKVSDLAEDLERFSHDALGSYRYTRIFGGPFGPPTAVIHPDSSDEVSAVLRYANQQRLPVVPYGAGTGVMGAAASIEGCLVLDLGRLNRILRISPDDMAATVQPGVVLKDLDSALLGRGLMLGHDPWSYPIATIGGAISTDSVGYRAAKYGSAGQQVLGLEVVLPEGDIMCTKAVPAPLAGPSLMQLFIGSEGAFGVITRATIRVFPYPERRIVRAFDFCSFEAGFGAIVEMRDLGVQPAMVDFYEEPPGEEIRLYLAFEGFLQEVGVQDRRAMEICLKHGGADLGAEEANRFWESRHEVAERYRKEMMATSRARRSASAGLKRDYIHVAIPVSRVLEYRRECRRLLSEAGIVVREWSIWGRPEFFSMIIADERPASGQAYPVGLRRAADRVVTLAQDMGGTMEYCHGVGIKLAHLMDRELGVGMDVLRKMKKGLDPNGILNPGKLGVPKCV